MGRYQNPSPQLNVLLDVEITKEHFEEIVGENVETLINKNKNKELINTSTGEKMKNEHIKAINELSEDIHQNNIDAGWWTDLKTGEKKQRNVGELLCLVHSEISEAMEGHRKNLMDDKLPHRKMFEVELADALIRIFDIAGAHNLDLGGAIAEKRDFNKVRPDHKMENRLKEDGKKY